MSKPILPIPAKRGGRFKDHAGKVYGKLTVVSEAGRNAHNAVVWLCRCYCGKHTVTDASKLAYKSGLGRGCYCSKDCPLFRYSKPTSGPDRHVLAVLDQGSVHHWTVVGTCDGTPYALSHVLCRCVCGTERPVQAYSLVKGGSRSCGCVQDNTNKKRRR